MNSIVLKNSAALLVLLLAVGALPIAADCNCTMPPAATSCCDGPQTSCASSDLSSDSCKGIPHEDSPALAIESDTSRAAQDSANAESLQLAQSSTGASIERAGPAPNKIPQDSDISIFALDCVFLI